jgi:putative peptidoglycan lipid II flippase
MPAGEPDTAVGRDSPRLQMPIATPDALVRSSAVVGAGTALSRVTGLLRIVALLYALGQTRLADAYTVANAMPNLVFELLLGGVLTATLVPVFVQQNERDDDGTSAVVTTATVALVVASLVGFLAAPQIIGAFSGSLGDASPAEIAAYQEVGTLLLRLFMPQVFFYGVMTLATAILSARRSFAVPAFAPVLNNLLVTTMFFMVPTLIDRDLHAPTNLVDAAADPTLVWILGLGTTAGVAVMALATLPAVARQRLSLHFRFDLRHPAVRDVVRLSGWTIGYVAANQAAIYVVLRLASTQGSGDVVAYTVAFTFFHLPHGLFAVSIMTAFLPELSDAAQRGLSRAFGARFGLGLRLMGLVILPASAGYMALSGSIVDVLPITSESVTRTSEVLTALSPGLFGFSVYIFALRGFYAHKDTRTPFMIHVVVNIANVVLAIPLVQAFGVVGLGVAYTIAYTIGAVIALGALGRRVGDLGLGRCVAPISKMAIASVLCGLAAWGVASVVSSGPFVQLAMAVPVGVAVYVAALWTLRVDEVHTARQRIRDALMVARSV